MYVFSGFDFFSIFNVKAVVYLWGFLLSIWNDVTRFHRKYLSVSVI